MNAISALWMKRVVHDLSTLNQVAWDRAGFEHLLVL